MSLRDQAPFSRLVELRIGLTRSVFVEKEVWDEVEKLRKSKPQIHSQLKAIVQRWSDTNNWLSREQFAFEGEHPAGDGLSARLWAFKPWGFRLYGVLRLMDGKESFIGVRVDPNKKKNKANRRHLEAAARRCRPYL